MADSMQLRELNKIKHDDSILDIILKLADGNPGAVTALTDLMKKEGTLSFSVPSKMILIDLDMHQIYGSDIWKLYKDCCNGDIDQVNLIFRHYNIGLLTHEEIKQHLPQHGRGIPFAELLNPEEIEDKVMQLTRDKVNEDVPILVMMALLSKALKDPKFEKIFKEAIDEVERKHKSKE